MRTPASLTISSAVLAGVQLVEAEPQGGVKSERAGAISDAQSNVVICLDLHTYPFGRLPLTCLTACTFGTRPCGRSCLLEIGRCHIPECGVRRPEGPETRTTIRSKRSLPPP